MATITQAERDAIVARDEALSAYLGNRCSYTNEEVAHLNPPTNAERSAVEVFDFVKDKPERYFLYIKETRGPQTRYYGLPDGEAVTWTGELLGYVTLGRPYQGNMGDTRVPIWVRAINGCEYHGTYYKSAGTYARVRKVKGRK